MNSIQRYEPTGLDDLQRYAKMLSVSGYFESRGNSEQAIAQMCVKIMAGAEMGYGPVASVQGIHVIQGRPEMSANLMAAAVKASHKYDYRVTEMSDKKVTVDFLENGEIIGTSTFTEQDAKRAQTKNTDKYPRNMLFARAISNGVKWYCPDVFGGNAVYSEGEIPRDSEDAYIVEEPIVNMATVPELDGGKPVFADSHIDYMDDGESEADKLAEADADRLFDDDNAIVKTTSSTYKRFMAVGSGIHGEGGVDWDKVPEVVSPNEVRGGGRFDDRDPMPPPIEDEPAVGATANKTIDIESDEYKGRFQRFNIKGRETFGDAWDVRRHEMVGIVTGGSTMSSKDLTNAQFAVVEKMLQVDSLGFLFYGDDWFTAESRRVVEIVTNGRTEDIDDITEQERQKIVSGLVKKIELASTPLRV